MPLQMDVKSEVIQKFELYEGRVNHFYLDTVGKVTVGVGHMVPSRTDASLLALYKTAAGGIAGQAATVPEKMAEYDSVLKQRAGLKASLYTTTLIMKDNDINGLRDKDIDSFYQNLTNIYRKANGYPADFDNLPKQVQKALFDMIFNLGPNRIVNVFRNFDAAVKAANWTEAGKQSNRPQVSSDRNLYVKNLFDSAARDAASKTSASPFAKTQSPVRGPL